MSSSKKMCPVFFAGTIVIAVILSAGCIGTETRATQPLPVTSFQPGQVLQDIGYVTGQGVEMQGVPRAMIDTVTFTIELTPSTKSIDLDNLTVIYADAVRTQTLTSIEGLRGDPPKGAWGILAIIHEAGKPNDRLEFDEQATIRISPAAAMLPGQLITIVVKPKEGPALTIHRLIPTTVTQGENVLQPA
jgi:archaellin